MQSFALTVAVRLTSEEAGQARRREHIQDDADKSQRTRIYPRSPPHFNCTISGRRGSAACRGSQWGEGHRNDGRRYRCRDVPRRSTIRQVFPGYARWRSHRVMRTSRDNFACGFWRLVLYPGGRAGVSREHEGCGGINHAVSVGSDYSSNRRVLRFISLRAGLIGTMWSMSATMMIMPERPCWPVAAYNQGLGRVTDNLTNYLI